MFTPNFTKPDGTIDWLSCVCAGILLACLILGLLGVFNL